MNLPAGKLFDSPLHIIDSRFPLVANQGYVPETFIAGDHLERVSSLGVRGGAMISGSFQGFDQGYPAMLGLVERGAKYMKGST